MYSLFFFFEFIKIKCKNLIIVRNKVDSMVQTVIVCAYINMIFAQILALYWYANELKEQVSKQKKKHYFSECLCL